MSSDAFDVDFDFRTDLPQGETQTGTARFCVRSTG